MKGFTWGEHNLCFLRYLLFRSLRWFSSVFLLCRLSVIAGQSVVPKDFCAFPRNELPNPAEYLSERPEMSS